MASSEEQSKTAVDLLRQFLAINTAHPAPDYQVGLVLCDHLALK